MMAASLSGSVTSFVAAHGLVAIFALMLVDAVFPAGSELVMVYGGALATGAIAGSGIGAFGHVVAAGWQGYLTAALAGTIGYLVGAVLGWLIGVYGGRPLLERHGSLLHLGPDRLERADRWFERRGDSAVLIGRVTPFVRSFVSIPAGAARMPLGRYVLLTLVGSAAWAFALAAVGWGVGASYRRFHSTFDVVSAAVVLVVVAAGVVLFIRARREASLGNA